MDIVEFLMARRKWRNMCLRCNIVPKEKIEIYKKTRLALVESNALGKSEHLLREAIQLTAPEWWGDETKFCQTAMLSARSIGTAATGTAPMSLSLIHI